ncbi:MAG: ribosome biogenesis GTPase Der [Bacteroidales bacterium]|jgi:GTP-binding protein|nr:ribosome biogenesis GTPase Der [Bacteroidales bacterium]
MAIAAIVGRPNVGKSTLFNRLIGKRQAIVDETEGVTRDRHYGVSDWNGHDFSVIDTGGYIVNSDDIFEEEIRKQVDLAINEADVILFVVDVEIGITDLDNAVAEILRRQDKPVILVVNKVDNNERILAATEFYSLGLGEYFTISSINGSGTGELLDNLVETFPKESLNKKDEFEGLPKLAVVGRPNAGKSSFINALIGEERNIVTDIAGTTRDSIHTRYNKFNHDFVIVDTAGIRKKSKVNEDLEFYSVMRAVRTIEDADICVLMLDATRGVESQDMSILQLVLKNKKGLVVVINKWDLIEKETNTMKEFTEAVQNRIAPFTDVPIIFTSVINKQRIHKVLDSAMEVYNNRTKRISTSTLNEVMLEAIEKYPPPSYKGKFIKIKYVTQLPIGRPAFAFFCNLPQYIKDPYKRYLENKLRDMFDFKGVPIDIFVRKK